MTDYPYPITAVIPMLKTDDEKHHQWLVEAIRGLPKGMPYLIAENEGKHQMANALNTALLNVTTDFIWVQGADDKAGRGTIDKLWSCIGTADVAYPSMRLMRESGSTIGKHHADIPSINRLQDENLCGVFLARTEAVRAVGGWRDEVIEDWDLIRRMAANGARFVAVPAATYQYRIHKKSLSHRIQDEAEKIGVNPTERAPDLHEDDRRPMLATFYCSTSMQVSYLRSQLPAKFLPGVARSTWDIGNRHKTPAAIFEHWNDRTQFDRCRKQGQACIIDVDDNYLSPHLLREMRRIHTSDGGWKQGQKTHRQLVHEADGIVCSTIPLAVTYAELNANVHVIPNMVDPDDWSEIHPLRLDDTIRIGWPAGKQHGPDAALIEDAMRWASAQPNVEVVCIGLDPGWDFAYHYEPFTPSPQTYRDIMSLLDVVVAPVKPNDLTRCKSDIKWLEAAMVGAPIIASRVEAYATIADGDTGLLANTKRDFLSHVKLLVSDADERIRLGRAAFEHVMEFRQAKDTQIPYMQVLASCGIGSLEFEPEEVAA